MQKVEAPYSFMEPPAARIEDRTQPMGPLEEGDQALVNAVQQAPAGEHMVRHDDGAVTRLVKDGSYKQDVVVANTTTPDGSTTGVSTLINTISSGGEGISASTSEWPAGGRGGQTTNHVSGNEVETGTLTMKPNRAKAQAVKLEAAQTINAAREQLEADRPADTGLTHVAALAENTLRDAAQTSEDRAAAARAAGDEASAGIHDIFGQAERDQASKVGQQILSQRTEQPKS